MEKTKKRLVTQLSEYDRKILNKYSRSYTNFVESPTASIEYKDDTTKSKEHKI